MGVRGDPASIPPTGGCGSGGSDLGRLPDPGHREALLLTCQVEHDGQPAVTRNYALEAYVHQKEQDTGGNHGQNISSPLLVVLFLVPKFLLVGGVSTILVYMKFWT